MYRYEEHHALLKVVICMYASKVSNVMIVKITIRLERFVYTCKCNLLELKQRILHSKVVSIGAYIGSR